MAERSPRRVSPASPRGCRRGRAPVRCSLPRARRSAVRARGPHGRSSTASRRRTRSRRGGSRRSDARASACGASSRSPASSRPTFAPRQRMAPAAVSAKAASSESHSSVTRPSMPARRAIRGGAQRVRGVARQRFELKAGDAARGICRSSVPSSASSVTISPCPCRAIIAAPRFAYLRATARAACRRDDPLCRASARATSRSPQASPGDERHTSTCGCQRCDRAGLRCRHPACRGRGPGGPPTPNWSPPSPCTR